MNNNRLIIIFLFVTGILSRIPFLERMQSHWDGPNYTLGILHYNIVEQMPSPPGYPLYIFFGKIFHLIIEDPHLSILSVSVLFSGIGAALLYIVGVKIFNKYVGLISAFIFLSGPTFYFFGITANPYGLLVSTACLHLLVVYYIAFKKKQLGMLLGLIYGFSIGIRPQDALFLSPLFIYGMYLLNWRNKIFSLIATFFSVLVWFIPLINSVGGLENYISVLKEYSGDALPSFSLSHAVDVSFIIVKGLFLSFGLSTLFLVYYILMLLYKRKNFKILITNKIVIIFILLILPSFLFNLFVRSDHAAHQMTYLTGLLLLIGYAIHSLLNKKHTLTVFTLLLLIGFNLFTFFRDRDPQLEKPYIPQSYHYSEIRKNDLRLQNKIAYIKKHYDPGKTYLITTEPMWRPFNYYLKDYQLSALFALDSMTEPYRYNRIDTNNWHLHWVKNYNLTFTIPDNISVVILLDDEAGNWIKEKQLTEIELGNKNRIVEIPVSTSRKLIYNFHSITVAD